MKKTDKTPSPVAVYVLVTTNRPVNKPDMCMFMPEAINAKEKNKAKMRDREGHMNGGAILNRRSGKLH